MPEFFKGLHSSAYDAGEEPLADDKLNNAIEK